MPKKRIAKRRSAPLARVPKGPVGVWVKIPVSPELASVVQDRITTALDLIDAARNGAIGAILELGLKLGSELRADVVQIQGALERRRR